MKYCICYLLQKFNKTLLIILLSWMFQNTGISQSTKMFAIDITSGRVLLDSVNLNSKSIKKIDSLKFKFDPFARYNSAFDTRNGYYLLESDTAIIVFKSNASLFKMIHKPGDVEGMVYDPVLDKVYCVLWKTNTFYFASLNIATGQFTYIRSLSDNSFHSATLDYDGRFYYIISDTRGLLKVDLITGKKIDSLKYFSTNNCACNSFDIETGKIVTKCILNGQSVMQLYNPVNKSFMTIDTFSKYGNGFFGYGSGVLDQNTGKWYVDLGLAIGIKNIRTNEKMDTIITPYNRIRSLAIAEKLCYRPIVVQSLTIQNPTCYNNSNGYLKLNLSGGRKPLFYTLDKTHFDTISSFRNLTSGSFNIDVKDKNGFCTQVAVVELTNPPSFKNSFSLKHNRCFFDSLGIISLHPNGASPPYQFSINHQSFIGDSVFNKLVKNDYFIQIRDRFNCLDTLKNVVIESPSQIVVERLSVEDIKCNGQNNGTLELKISGGVKPYRIYTDNVEFDSIYRAFNLSVGSYFIVCTDRNGCSVQSAYSISEPPPFQLSAYVEDSPCYGDNKGLCKLSISGGLSNDHFLIQMNGKTLNSSIDDTLHSISPGVYCFRVSNQHDCKDSLKVTVAEPPEFIIMKMADTTLCNGQYLKINRRNIQAKSFQTKSNTGLLIETDTMTLTQAGVYFFEATNLSNCKSKDTFIISKIDMDVMHDFLIPTVAFLSDTVYAVNISLPVADKTEWLVDRHILALFPKDNSAVGLRFNDTGKYNITLSSRFKSCGYNSTKSVYIKDTHDSNMVAEKYGYLGPMIQKFEVYANPHDGQHFKINVQLRDTTSFSIYKLDPGSGYITGEMHFTNQKSVEFTSFTSTKSEVYYLKLIVGKESKVIKVVAVY